MTRPQGFGAECEHGRLARKCERCADADEIALLRDCAKQYEQWLAADHATIADLRSRLALFEEHVCRGCGCAARQAPSPAVCDYGDDEYCEDCAVARLSCVRDGWSRWPEHAAACISVGLRALCGRRILEGVE